MPHIRCKEKCKSCSETAKEILSIRFGIILKRVNSVEQLLLEKIVKLIVYFLIKLLLILKLRQVEKYQLNYLLMERYRWRGCKNEEDAHKTVMILIKYLKKIGDIEEPGTVTLPLNEDEYKIMLKMKETMNKNKWRNYVYNKKSEHIKASILAKMNKYEIPIIRKAVEDKNKDEASIFQDSYDK